MDLILMLVFALHSDGQATTLAVRYPTMETCREYELQMRAVLPKAIQGDIRAVATACVKAVAVGDES